MITKEQQAEMRRASNSAIKGAPLLRAAGLTGAADLGAGLAGNCLLLLDAIDEMERERDEARARCNAMARAAAGAAFADVVELPYPDQPRVRPIEPTNRTSRGSIP